MKQEQITFNTGRTLNYYRLANFDENDREKLNAYVPIIYFHGYPAFPINSINVKCEIYGLVRPSKQKDGDYLKNFIDDIWELISIKKWKKFSVLGVSAGGPYSLAFLASYLKKTTNEKPKLLALTNVASFYRFDKKKLIHINHFRQNRKKNIFSLIDDVSPNDTNILFNVQNYLKYIFSSCKESKEFGRYDDENSTIYIEMKDASAFDQSASVYEIEDLRNTFEDFIKSHYNSKENWTEEELPKITLFHGAKDVNSPISQGRYLHEVVFGRSSHLVEFPECNHLSLIFGKSHEYIQTITCAQ